MPSVFRFSINRNSVLETINKDPEKFAHGRPVTSVSIGTEKLRVVRDINCKLTVYYSGGFFIYSWGTDNRKWV
jgi:hypothetical protein